MSHYKSLFFFIGILVLSPSFLLASSQSRNSESVQDSARLALLNQATGNSSGNTSTFQTRLDDILSTSVSPERSIRDTEMAAAQQKTASNLKAEADAAVFAQERSPERYNPKKVKDNSQIADSSAAKDFKYDGTEKAYQAVKENIQKEFDEKLKAASDEALKKKMAAHASAGAPSASASGSSMAGNPFYVGEDKDPSQKKFESRKAVIVSRLLEHGLDEEQANSAVGQATGEEDLVVHLMKDYGLTYGDASDAAS